jgi:hypothetical protein
MTTRNPRSTIDKSLIWTVGGFILAAGVWAGRIEYQVTRIAELEKQAQETAVVVGMFKVMYFYKGLPK